MLTVEYGGAFFHSVMRQEAFGDFLIVKDGFEGWWGRPASRGTDAVHMSGHGGPLLPRMVGVRQVALSGRLMRADWSTAKLAERLSGLPLDGPLTVREGADSQWANAQLIDVVIDRAVERANAAFQLIWRCPDPHKYGPVRESVSSGANVQAFHYGNTDAWPVFEVSGFPNGYRIEGRGQNLGQFYTVTEKPSGAVDRVDFSTGMFTRDGTARTRVSTQRNVWPVAPFVDTPWRVTALGSGSGSARMLVPDTWV